VAELSRANNDMNNLLAGTGVGTVFVDHQMCIARFTPAATQVINLIPGDVGRPLEHVASNLTHIVGYDRMIEDISSVLETLIPREAELQVKNGSWYLMRIRPYRTAENVIEGAVITLVDISERKKIEESLRHSESRLNALINHVYAGVIETDLRGRIVLVNDRLCDSLGYSREELMGRRLQDLVDPQDLAAAQARLDALAAGGANAEDEQRYIRRDGGRLRVRERISAVRDEQLRAQSLLILSFDIPERAPHK
jgi:two-component system, chemotaxis family, CheB/CheR fusion protein